MLNPPRKITKAQKVKGQLRYNRDVLLFAAGVIMGFIMGIVR